MFGWSNSEVPITQVLVRSTSHKSNLWNHTPCQSKPPSLQDVNITHPSNRYTHTRCGRVFYRAEAPSRLLWQLLHLVRSQNFGRPRLSQTLYYPSHAVDTHTHTYMQTHTNTLRAYHIHINYTQYTLSVIRKTSLGHICTTGTVCFYSACVNPDVDALTCNWDRLTKESLHAKQRYGESKTTQRRIKKTGILYKLETGGKAEGHL